MAALLARKTASRARAHRPASKRSSRRIDRPQIAQRTEEQRVRAEEIELAEVPVRAKPRGFGVLPEHVGLDRGLLVRRAGASAGTASRSATRAPTMIVWLVFVPPLTSPGTTSAANWADIDCAAVVQARRIAKVYPVPGCRAIRIKWPFRRPAATKAFSGVIGNIGQPSQAREPSSAS